MTRIRVRKKVRMLILMQSCALITLLYKYGADLLTKERHTKQTPAFLQETPINNTDMWKAPNVSGDVSDERAKLNNDQYGAGLQTKQRQTKQETESKIPINKREMSKVPNVPVEVFDELMKLNDEQVRQDDPRLVKIIRDHFIHPPSTDPYNLVNPYKTDYAGQGKDFVVPNILKDLPENSFFIECGAHNGELLSSTLYFEKTKHHKGLLIEANLDLFQELLQKHRKAFSVNACLSTKPHPSVMTFNQLDGIGRLVEGTFEDAYRHHTIFKLKKDMVQLQCFPLYSILLALDQLHVDFMGLDVEGVEMDILRTIPWDKVHISNILAEFSHGAGGWNEMKHYFESNGYRVKKNLPEDILVESLKPLERV